MQILAPRAVCFIFTFDYKNCNSEKDKESQTASFENYNTLFYKCSVCNSSFQWNLIVTNKLCKYSTFYRKQHG